MPRLMPRRFGQLALAGLRVELERAKNLEQGIVLRAASLNGAIAWGMCSTGDRKAGSDRAR